VKYTVTLIFLLLFSSAFGQIRGLKLNIGSAAIGAPGIAFEHVRKKKLAWQVGGAYLIPNQRESFFYKSLLNGRSMQSGKITGFSASIEHRWYTKAARRAHMKPYVSLFSRFYQFDISVQFTDEQTDYDLGLKSQNIGAGVQVGIQWVIRDKFSIDVAIIGAGYGRNSLSGEVTTTGGDPNIGILEDDISEMPLLGNRIKLKSDGDVHRFNSSYGSLIYRGAIFVGVLF
jgi:hypothetical protein